MTGSIKNTHQQQKKLSLLPGTLSLIGTLLETVLRRSQELEDDSTELGEAMWYLSLRAMGPSRYLSNHTMTLILRDILLEVIQLEEEQ